jgi:hypothetical protein
MPNDNDEANRLDMMHEMSLALLKRKLFLAPIGDSPRRILDLGTGTGIWAIDFGKFQRRYISLIINCLEGDQYPSAEVGRPSFPSDQLACNTVKHLGHWRRFKSYSANPVRNPPLCQIDCQNA